MNLSSSPCQPFFTLTLKREIIFLFVVFLYFFEVSKHSSHLQGQQQDKSFLRNKLSQIISLAFVVDYPRRWPSFFTDLLQTLGQGHLAVDMYLRTLQQIDSEVVDRDIVHTQLVGEVILL